MLLPYVVLLERPTQPARSVLVRALRRASLGRRSRRLRDLRRRASWAAEARTGPTLEFWTEAVGRPALLRLPADRKRRK